jgi:hypothetical protein
MRRPSPSTVLAFIAVFAASGGIGYAAGSIGSAQIKDNAIQSRDVKDGTLQAKDLSGSALDDLEGDAGPAGAKGAAGTPGAPGAPGANGANGAEGPKGADGTNGLKGSDGAAGPAGPTGSAGTVGATGAKGATGSTGPSGSAGPTGPVGPATVTAFTRENSPAFSGAFLNIFSVSIAAGSYVVAAKTTLDSNGPATSCILKTSTTERDRVNTFGAGVETESLLAAFTVAQTSTLTFYCEVDGGANASVGNSAMTITKVGSATSTAQ